MALRRPPKPALPQATHRPPPISREASSRPAPLPDGTQPQRHAQKRIFGVLRLRAQKLHRQRFDKDVGGAAFELVEQGLQRLQIRIERGLQSDRIWRILTLGRLYS